MVIIFAFKEEIYKTITYPTIAVGKYEISNYGNIKNILTQKSIKHFPDKKNYNRLILMGCDKTPVNVFAHRLVAWEFVDGYDESTERVCVNHRNSDPQLNYYRNLEWVTVDENNKHGIKHGSIRFGRSGEYNYSCKYNKDIVHEICLLLEKNYTQMQIMHHFGYKSRKDNNSLYSLIDGIKRRQVWTEISKKYCIIKRLRFNDYPIGGGIPQQE